MKVQDAGSPQSTKKPGRPLLGTQPTRNVNLTLTQKDIDFAKVIGGGNVSRGVRMALGWTLNTMSEIDEKNS